MKRIIIISIVFFLFLPTVFAETCYIIKSGQNTQLDNGPAVLELKTNDMSWSYNTGSQIVATGKITARVEDKPGSKGHNCSVQAQLLLMRGNEILACYTAPEAEGVTGAYLSFEHTFIVGSNYGPLESLSIKSRAYAFACFSNPVYGNSDISYIQENTCNYYTPTPVVVPPSNPTNLTLTNSSYFVLLNWSGGEGANSFEVYRKTGYYGSWGKIGTTTSKTFLDDWVSIESNQSLPGVDTFYYRVRAYNSAGFSPGYSNIVSVVGILIE